MPGNERSSEPWITSRRRPSNGSTESLVGDPRREPEHAFDPRVVRDRDRDGAAHREAEQESALGVDSLDRRACVLETRVEVVPRLDPVLDLREPKLRELRRDARDEPFERRAPCPFDRGCLPAVHANDRRPLFRSADAYLCAHVGRNLAAYRHVRLTETSSFRSFAPRSVCSSTLPMPRTYSLWSTVPGSSGVVSSISTVFAGPRGLTVLNNPITLK